MAPSKRRRGGAKKASSTAAAAKKRKKSEISTENVLPQEKEEEEVGKEIETVVVEEIEEIPADPPVVPSIPVEPPVDCGKASSSTAKKLGSKNEISTENVLTQEEEEEVGKVIERVVEQTLAPVLSADPPVVDLDSDSAADTKRLPSRDEKSDNDLLSGDLQQTFLRNEGDDSSVGGDSPVGDISSGQQQLCEDQTEVEVLDCIQDDNKEKGESGSEHMDTRGRKVDLTQSFVSDQVFDSRDALIEWCQEVGRKNKSVVVVSKSRNPVLGRPSMLELGCERGDVYQDHKKKTDTSTLKDLTKRRESGTRKCGCPFTLKGVWMEGDKWKVRVHCGTHNHELPETLVGHSDVARLKEEEKEILVDLTKSGIRHRRVLSPLKQRSKENMSTTRTIDNASAAIKLMEVEGKSAMHTPCSVNVLTMKKVNDASAAIKLMEVEGKSAMQQVLGLLLKHHYVEWHRRDDKTDDLKDIFWAHPESLQLVLGSHSVLIVDCTYKTNRFGSPLLRIVGVTSTGKLFTVAFIFMEAETEDHYTWALTRLKRLFSPNALPSTFVTDGELKLVNAIGTVFPKAKWLFCSLHVLKKVSENCKQYFESDEEFERFMKEWTNLTQAKTKDEYADTFCDFVLTWTSYPGCIQYLRDNWLGHKEHYVLAWTKFIKHFGNTAINRVGSSHAILKSQLAASNFSTCWTTMHKMICDEIIDIKASFEKSLISVPHEYLLPAFKELRGCVSHKAMELLLLECSRSEDVGFDVGVCGCVLRLSYGLPCAHEIVQYFRNGTEIPLSEIDSQWKLLSTIPVPEDHSEFDYLPELKSVRERWEKASKSEREIMQKKLEETACL
ncbi:PKS-NRPS hybrid synthetase CHGG_01239-like [Papaver somniferum]|uniref:PKS-NRPS hybrid synthetase CHGG_01239-like n=1 Tax=Papaver somniferum TaxID=3469 RepID=UPI000E705C2E|nr:PKS-NRPS hybrid synthetase CHGG_01239-like [Papaver somniferum]XP_026419242.1 PKS-NRPS hybrid synthetase CHGG_01239-like [Papaver somniferum]